MFLLDWLHMCLHLVCSILNVDSIKNVQNIYLYFTAHYIPVLNTGKYVYFSYLRELRIFSSAYHNLHFSWGFILLPTLQLKASENSSILDSTPFTLHLDVACWSDCMACRYFVEGLLHHICKTASYLNITKISLIFDAILSLWRRNFRNYLKI